MTLDPSQLPDDIATLKAMVIAGGREIEALKLTIAKMRRDKFGASSERGARLLDQLELQLAEIEEGVAQETATAQIKGSARDKADEQRLKPARRALPAHLPRERVVHSAPSSCPGCGGALRKLGEDITETLEHVPAQWKVIQHVREKFSCRKCEAITQAPAPSHPIARGRAGPQLLAQVLFAKYRAHLPLNRQSDIYAKEGVDLDTSTLADWVGACAATLMPLVDEIRDHVFAAERIHADDTTVPVLASGKTRTGRLWAYVRDDKPFGGRAAPAAIFYYSPDRGGEHPEKHLVDYSGLMQAGRLCRLQRPLRCRTQAGADHRGGVLGARAAQVVRAGRAAEGADCDRGRAPHRRALRHRTRDQWPLSGPTRRRPSSTIKAARRRARKMDAPRAPQALLQKPACQGSWTTA